MAIITRQNVKTYIEEWKETHEDEELDEAVAEDCLQDEAQTIIDTLVEADLEVIENGSDLVQQVLRWGFDGYENMDLNALWEELKTRGLEI